jgi:hypothetical protein
MLQIMRALLCVSANSHRVFQSEPARQLVWFGARITHPTLPVVNAGGWLIGHVVSWELVHARTPPPLHRVTPPQLRRLVPGSQTASDRARAVRGVGSGVTTAHGADARQ